MASAQDQTDAQGICLAPPAALVNSVLPGQLDTGVAGTATYGIFVTGGGITIAFDPALNRIFLRLSDQAGVTRGATSVAVRTQ